MHRATTPVLLALTASLALPLLLTPTACSAEAPPTAPGPEPAPTFGLLPDADAGSAVRIAAVEGLCRKVDAGNALPVTGLAFTGQRLRWKGVVHRLSGARLVVGVDRLQVSMVLDFQSAGDFAAGDEVEVEGVISGLDPRARTLTLQEHARVTPL